MNTKIDLNLVDPQALHLMWTLYQAGFEARLAGGAVRDLIIGVSPKDWDIATTAHPDQVVDVMNSWGIHTIPTGLQHGTITAVINEDNYEITTLRADTATDGRHAEVEFIDDWKEDAARRDFTMNAMYLDSDGVVHDYFDGVTHLGQGFVRFVGDPHERIREDYLRILRYFRFRSRLERKLTHESGVFKPFGFFSHWNWGHGDETTKEAIQLLSPHLSEISGERIWSEVRRILGYEGRSYAAFQAMSNLGVLDSIDLGGATGRLHNLGHWAYVSNDPAVQLASVFHLEDIDSCVTTLRDRFKVSREELDPVEFARDFINYDRTRINAFRLLSEYPKHFVLAWVAIGRNVSENTFDTTHTTNKAVGGVELNYLQNLHTFVKDMNVPEFPVRGQDLLDRGLAPGPEVGRLLKEMRRMWADLEFNANKEYLLTAVGF